MIFRSIMILLQSADAQIQTKGGNPSMLDFVFIDEPGSRNVWFCPEPSRQWFDTTHRVVQAEIWRGCRIGDSGAIQTTASAYLPTVSSRLLELRSTNSLGQSNLPAALRAMLLLGYVETNQETPFGSDLIESAVAACTRPHPNVSAARLDDFSGHILKLVDSYTRDQLMGWLPDGLPDTVEFLVRNRRARFSPETFVLEYEAGLLSYEDCLFCHNLAEEAGPVEDYRAQLFPPDVLQELTVDRMIRGSRT